MKVNTDLSFIKSGETFPPLSELNRIHRYTINSNRFDGSYANNRYLELRDNQGVIKRLPWRVLKVNKFKLYTNKMDNLIFQGDPIIMTGNKERDIVVNNLVEKTRWLRSIRKAVRTMEKLGDGAIKTFVNGCSAFNPKFGIKVVRGMDAEDVIAYVLYEYIYDKDSEESNKVSYIRFEIHFKGSVQEIVYELRGSTLGASVDFYYQGRKIKKGGNIYQTGVDEFLVQWLSIDVSEESVYGSSPYEDFADLVYELERRQTLEIKVIDAHSEPIVVVGTGYLCGNEETGEYEAPILGSIIEVPQNGVEPKYITWDGKIEASEQVLDRISNQIYEVTEFGKIFMTGEYKGNISDESINSLIRSAIDRANRHVWEIYYEVVKSLYVLCRLNGIEVDINDISIVFQIGQTDDREKVANVINSRVAAGTMSRVRALQEFDEMTEQQAQQEIANIFEEKRKERAGG
jgi:hypothetical protein